MPDFAADVQNLTAAPNLPALWEQFDAIVARLPVDFWSVAIIPLGSGVDRSPILHGTFPKAYVDGYLALDAHTIDPYLRMLSERVRPFWHKDVLPEFDRTEIGRKLKVLAVESDIRQGYGIPMPSDGMARGVAFWAGANNDRFEPAVRANEPYLAFIAAHLCAAAEDLGFKPKPAWTPILSDREREVLTGLALGETTEEIANRLGITARTVRFHLANACEKLETPRRAHAVSRALKQGLIDI